MAFFPKPLPKFNLYSFAVEDSSKGKLLAPQSEALKRLQEFFQRNPAGRIGLVSMPTGSGKSGIISCLPYFLGRLGLNQPPAPGAQPYGEPLYRFDNPVLVVTPDLTILRQLEERLTVSPDAHGENFLMKTKIIPEEFHRALPHGVKIQETAHLDDAKYLRDFDIVITNVHKFLDNNKLPDDFFKLVIVDEAHHHPASMWRRIVQKCKNHAMVVFFTATPFRGDKKPVLTTDEGEVVYHLSLERARTDRIIRRLKWDPLRTNDTELDSIFQLILERVKSLQDEKNRAHPLPDNLNHIAIAITNNIKEAKQVADRWNELWDSPDSAIAYHSKLEPEPFKRRRMQQIRSNRVNLVVVVEMLLEGFDYPPISIAAIMTKITSRVKFAQFLGRSQRVVRGQEGLESEDIWADVVTHSHFQQEENYRAYEEALLIDPDE